MEHGGRSRLRRGAAWLVAGVVLVSAAGAAAPASARFSRLATPAIPLPSPADHLATTPNATQLLGPDRPNEVLNRAPGPVDDDERVRVGMAADGSVASVAVDQRLDVHGTGDFSLKIPGPALDVQAPPDASNQPGLRRGSVIWEGFSGGSKSLAATVTLDPAVETAKLPLAVRSGSGRTTIENRTALPVPVATGVPEPRAAEAVLDQVRALVAAGKAPEAGAGGIPASVVAAAGSTVANGTIDVLVPLRVTGTVTAPGGAVTPVDAIVPGPAAPDGVLTMPVQGAVRLTATPSLPDPAVLVPGPGADAGVASLRTLQVALWQVLRLSDVSAYLGNPAPGRSTTTYVYEPAVAAPVRAGPAQYDDPKPVPIALSILAVVVLLGAGAVVWARN